MDILNGHLKPFNIMHFQGGCKTNFQTLIDAVIDSNDDDCNITVPENLTIVSTWTDESKCMLLRQANKYGFNIINSAAEYQSDEEWKMTSKLSMIKNALDNVKTEYVLVLDGYDVLIHNLDGIIEKFQNTGYDILFNASRNNHPFCDIDHIDWREELGECAYLNAGCAIGKTSAMVQLYEDCLNDGIYNPYDSEQYIVRHIFGEVSNDGSQTKMFFDYKCDIFMTFSHAALISQKDNEYIVV